MVRTKYSVISMSFLKDAKQHKLLIISAVLTGWAFQYILNAVHDDVPVLSFFALVGRALSVVWHDWSSHRWVYHVVLVIIFWIYGVVTGWLIAEFHPPVPRAAITAVVISLAAYNGFFLLQLAIDPNAFSRVLILWAAVRSAANITGIFLGGRLVTRRLLVKMTPTTVA